jgi:hypothetical protein
VDQINESKYISVICDGCTKKTEKSNKETWYWTDVVY